MSGDLFRTVVAVPPSSHKISYKSFPVLFGSCFTEHIGERLRLSKLPSLMNPFGITYNPSSVKSNIDRLLSGQLYTISDLSFDREVYFSFDHHSKFSDTAIDLCLHKINSYFLAACEKLKTASHLFLTFGTAYYYVLKSKSKVVSNCHKLPEKDFNRERLTVDEIVTGYRELFKHLLQYNPELKVVFTVSPIRHWKDGAHENQLSKSVLFLAIDQLCSEFPYAGYFPAYEILMDELRDYRFYEEDMLHPSRLAVDFIWNKFQDCFMERETRKIMEDVEKIQLARNHRPFNAATDSFRSFAAQQLHKLDQLVKQVPDIDVTEEYSYFRSYLK